MKNQQEQPGAVGFSQRDSFWALYMLANAHSACFWPFIRHSFGIEGLGLNGVLALILMLVYAAATNSSAMFYFIAVWVGAVVIQRIRTMTLIRRGWIEHSKYTGYPWLAMRFPFVRREVTAKTVIEPMLCLIAGPLLCSASVPVGQFVLFGFISMMVKAGIDRQLIQSRVRRMHDAQIEQRLMAQRFNGERDDF